MKNLFFVTPLLFLAPVAFAKTYHCASNMLGSHQKLEIVSQKNEVSRITLVTTVVYPGAQPKMETLTEEFQDQYTASFSSRSGLNVIYSKVQDVAEISSGGARIALCRQAH